MEAQRECPLMGLYSWACNAYGPAVVCHRDTATMYAQAPCGIACPAPGFDVLDVIETLEKQDKKECLKKPKKNAKSV